MLPGSIAYQSSQINNVFVTYIPTILAYRLYIYTQHKLIQINLKSDKCVQWLRCPLALPSLCVCVSMPPASSSEEQWTSCVVFMQWQKLRWSGLQHVEPDGPQMELRRTQKHPHTHTCAAAFILTGRAISVYVCWQGTPIDSDYADHAHALLYRIVKLIQPSGVMASASGTRPRGCDGEGASM